MTPRLAALLDRVFAHRYPEGVDRVDFREARALWLAEQGREAGAAPVIHTADGQPWPYTAPAHLPGLSRDERPPAPCDYDQH